MLRFRPIMMTTMAAMLGALPLALGAGDGAEMRRPLGIAIVGGLLVSQVLTLYTTPVVYLYLDRFRLWALRVRARRASGRCRPRKRLIELVADTDAERAYDEDRVAIESRTIALLIAVRSSALRLHGRTRITCGPPRRFPRRTRKSTAGRSRSPATTAPRGNWWEAFNDPDLNALEAQVDISNQTIQAAAAAMREARAATQAARAALFPVVSADAACAAQQSRGRHHQQWRKCRQLECKGVEQQLQRRARRELGDRSVGRNPPQHRGERDHRAGHRRRPRRRHSCPRRRMLAQDYLLLRVQDAQIELLRDTVAALPALAARLPATNTRPASPGAATSRRPKRSSSRRRRRCSMRRSRARSSSTRSRC